MSIIPLGKQRTKMIYCLLEAQAHRCAVCQVPIAILEHHYDSDHYAGVVKIDRSLPKTYMNAVAVCGKCGGSQHNYDSLIDFYNGRLEKSVKKIKSDSDPMVIEAIKMEIARLGGDPALAIKECWGHAPMEAVGKIAATLVARQMKQPKKKRSYPIWMTNGLKRALMEVQRHRCAYCFSIFDAENFASPRYPTWEHVEKYEESKSNLPDNLVIACQICNGLRNKMNMSAYEYSEWAKDNLDTISKRVKHSELRFRQTQFRKGSDWVEQQHTRHGRKKKFYEE